MMNSNPSCAVLCAAVCLATVEPVGYLICVVECSTFFCTDPPGDTSEPVAKIGAPAPVLEETAAGCACAPKGTSRAETAAHPRKE